MNLSQQGVTINLKFKLNRNLNSKIQDWTKKLRLSLNKHESFSFLQKEAYGEIIDYFTEVTAESSKEYTHCLITPLYTSHQLQILIFDKTELSKNSISTLGENYALTDFKYVHGRRDRLSSLFLKTFIDKKSYIRLYNYSEKTYSKNIRKFFDREFSLRKKDKIPNNVHFIWLIGNKNKKTFSLDTLKQIKTWLDVNPEFNFIFWTNIDGNISNLLDSHECLLYFKKEIESRLKIKRSKDIYNIFIV